MSNLRRLTLRIDADLRLALRAYLARHDTTAQAVLAARVEKMILRLIEADKKRGILTRCAGEDPEGNAVGQDARCPSENTPPQV